MTTTNLVRSEQRKLTTTHMPLAFVAVLAVVAVLNGVAVAIGTDFDGTKTFISTAADQQSLMAFAANSLMVSTLFGAIAAAREYGHKTVIATYLNTPNRARALGAQFIAIAGAGAFLGLTGATFTIIAVAVTLPLTDFGFMVTAGGVAQILIASAWAGAAGAVIGAGIGTVVRNTGGAVTGAVLALMIAPPLVVQLTSAAEPWAVPQTLALVTSGVMDDTSTLASIVAIGLWALTPTLAALWSVQRRDVT